MGGECLPHLAGFQKGEKHAFSFGLLHNRMNRWYFFNFPMFDFPVFTRLTMGQKFGGLSLDANKTKNFVTVLDLGPEDIVMAILCKQNGSPLHLLVGRWTAEN